jgi:hypothetical protein
MARGEGFGMLAKAPQPELVVGLRVLLREVADLQA